MERLLYSSSPTPFKLALKPSPFLRRLGRVDSSRLGFSPLTRTVSSRVGIFSCKNENPSPSSACSSSPLDNSRALPSYRIGSPNGSVPKPNFLEQIAVGASEQRKVWYLSNDLCKNCNFFGFPFVGLSFMIANDRLLHLHFCCMDFMVAHTKQLCLMWCLVAEKTEGKRRNFELFLTFSLVSLWRLSYL